jgi:hypothetical protein
MYCIARVVMSPCSRCSTWLSKLNTSPCRLNIITKRLVDQHVGCAISCREHSVVGAQRLKGLLPPIQVGYRSYPDLLCRPDLSFVPHAQEKDGNLCRGSIAVDRCTDIRVRLLNWNSCFAPGHHLGQCSVYIMHGHDCSELRFTYLEWVCAKKQVAGVSQDCSAKHSPQITKQDASLQFSWFSCR